MTTCARAALGALLALAAAPGCGGEEAEGASSPAVDGSADGAGGAPAPTPAPDGEPYDTLAEWHLFADPVAQEPAEGVVPFDVISVLFSDHSLKERFLWIPPGETIGWSDEGEWDVPVGSIAIKTFYFPNDARDPGLGRRLLETRLLVHEAEGWAAHTYIWDEAQTEARRDPVGRALQVEWVDASGQRVEQRYNVPNVFQCQECHGSGEEMRLLGPRTRQLDRVNDYGSGPVNQLDHMASLGLFDVAPPEERVRLADPFGDGPLVERVRAYFDANCGHCHGPGGHAHSSNFLVTYELTDPETGNPRNWGICKFPTSAGRATGGLRFDVVPGSPDESILIHRMESTEPTVKMPPVPTRLADLDGAALIREWIEAMPAERCD